MPILKKARADFRRSIIAMAMFSLISNVLLLTMPLYMLQVYDRVLPSKSSDTLIFLSIIAFAAIAVLGALEAVRQVMGNRVAARLDANLGDDVMKRVIEEGHRSNGNTQPVRDLQTVRGMLASRVIFGLLDLPFAFVFIAILYLIHPQLFVLTLCGVGVLVLVALLNQFFQSRYAKAGSRSAIVAATQAENLARNADSLIAMGMISNTLKRWGNENADALVAADRAGRVNAFFTGFSRVMRLGLQIAILGFGAVLVLEGEMTAGMIFAASIISGRAMQPIDAAIGSWRQLAAGSSAWKRLKKFMNDHCQARRMTRLPEPKGELEAVGLLQPNPLDRNKPPTLARVSFKLRKGQSVAVLGPSGSGKSTLARMLVGALEPFSGEVRIDGHDIRNWDREHLGRFIGYLAQDVELLPGTVAQNIARFGEDASDEAVVAAARMAHAEELIQQLPDGYDTLLGPGGMQISGGEKQRIGLARAFYGSPKILVLDEPNSSLDRIGEAALMRALLEARKNGVSVFLITQREMAINAVDLILRMNQGQVTDFDDRDKVIARYASPPGTTSAARTSKPPMAARPAMARQATPA